MSIYARITGLVLITSALAVGASVYVQGAQNAAKTPAPAATAAAPADHAELQAVIGKYCVGCHSERLKSGDLVLEKKELSQASTEPEAWERVARKLRARAMPPIGSPRPDVATLDRLRVAVEAGLDKTVTGTPNPGRPPIHAIRGGESPVTRYVIGLEA